LDDLGEFPKIARRDAGYRLRRVRDGLEPQDWKPMNSIGAGVRKIRVRDDSGSSRVINVASLPDAIYVLHAFQKKTQKSSKRDLDLAAMRLRQIIRGRAG
jgi:phage-related protein